MSTRPDVLIVGAGLAGLSAGHYLSSKGKHVHIVEARPYVGGRTASWNENGMLVESGLHRFLGFYTELPKLMESAGIELDEVLVWEDEIEIRIPDGGPTGVYGLALLHKPLKSLSGLFAENEVISPGEKVTLTKFLLAGIAEYLKNPDGLDDYSVAEYAQKHEIDKQTLERVLVPLTEGIFFLPPQKYSALPFFGLLAQATKEFRVGVASFKGGMTDVLANPIAQAIRQRGGQVRLGSPVERLIVKEGRVIGAKIHGQDEYAAHVILATSLKPAQDIIALSGLSDSFADMLALPTMPAATIQMELEKPAAETDRTTFAPGTILSAFAEQSRTTFTHVPGRLSVILTPPERFLDRPHNDILAQVIAEAKRINVDLKRQVTNYRIINHPHDFYSLTCGSEKLRPTQATPIPGLSLAGDYTKQEFFATMEGAVRSGIRAAEHTLDELKKIV